MPVGHATPAFRLRRARRRRRIVGLKGDRVAHGQRAARLDRHPDAAAVDEMVEDRHTEQAFEVAAWLTAPDHPDDDRSDSEAMADGGVEVDAAGREVAARVTGREGEAIDRCQPVEGLGFDEGQTLARAPDRRPVPPTGVVAIADEAAIHPGIGPLEGAHRSPGLGRDVDGLEAARRTLGHDRSIAPMGDDTAPDGTFTADILARRSGVGPDDVRRLTELGILLGDPAHGYTDADVRRIHVVQALERDGMPIDAVGGLVRDGAFSLEFIDAAGVDVFAAVSDVTFAELAERTGIPIETLTALRDVTGTTTASPNDRVREDELAILPLIEYQLELGFRPQSVERALRVYRDSLRRIAEAEAEWWRSEVQVPMLSAGVPAGELAAKAGEISPRLSEASDRAVMAVYHAQQMQVWSRNIVDGIGAALEQAGLHTREEQVPAMCFLDISGYTELTSKRGDTAAAELAERLGRTVRPISVQHGGRPVKWLGDGVMFHFHDPGEGVIAACKMVAALAAAGLPPAHVGVHAGPLVIQEGDYYGQTVNLARGSGTTPGRARFSSAARSSRPPPDRRSRSPRSGRSTSRASMGRSSCSRRTSPDH